MSNWDFEKVKQALEANVRMARSDVARCKAKVRHGSLGHKRFYDIAVAEELIGDLLSVDAALEARDTFEAKLDRLKVDIEEGKLKVSGLYDEEEFKRGATAYVDRLANRFLVD